MEGENTITLYPSNWLYNAGVVGFLRVLERTGIIIEKCFDNGTVKFDKNNLLKSALTPSIQIDELFQIPKLLQEWLDINYEKGFKSKKNKKEVDISDKKERIKTVWGTLFNVYYRGFFNANTQYLYKSAKKSKPLIEQITEFVKNMLNPLSNAPNCDFCLASDKNYSGKNRFTSEHNYLLGASAGDKGMPNVFWNLEDSKGLTVCDFCSFILMNYHLAMIRLSDTSQIFINAPSFKIMWYLNEYARKVYGKEKIKEVKQILGMSLIEMASKMYVQLGKWTKMNIEVVSKYGDRIDFFVLPYEIVDILSDREIASLLNDIGEFKVLNMVLDGKFYKILEFGERVMRISLKPKNEWGKHEKNFISKEIKLEKNKNKSKLLDFSNKLFKLYALINEKQKIAQREV